VVTRASFSVNLEMPPINAHVKARRDRSAFVVGLIRRR
jgi:hypothetical protein